MNHANSTLLPLEDVEHARTLTPVLPLIEANTIGVSPVLPPTYINSSAGSSAPVSSAIIAPSTIRLASGLAFTPASKHWEQTPEERELVSASISQTWTDQAMRCYMTGAHCTNCDIPQGNYSFACQMDKVVPVLLDSLGQPDPHRLKRIYPQGYPHTAY
jgi:hypothetical protein